MPFKSEAQRRYLHAKHPEVAKRFEAETPADAKLPKRVSKGVERRPGAGGLRRRREFI